MRFSTTKNLLKCITIISFLHSNLSAQIKNNEIEDSLKYDMKDSIAKKSYLKFSTSYLTNYIYNGRRDSITSPYITPLIGYFNKKGLNASFSGYYLNAAKQRRFDFFSLDLNYVHEFNKKFAVSLLANRTFYDKSSTALSSDIRWNFGINVDYDLKFIELFVEGDAVISQKTDFALNLELLKEFSVENNDDEFKIAPAFDINWSTLNYYEGYFNRKNGRKKSTIINSVTTVDNNRFTLMDYEFSLPMSYETNQFVFFVTPTYVIPKNTITTTTVRTTSLNNSVINVVTYNSTTKIERELKQTFFVEFGVYYKLDL
ncbi:hypothetical protein [Flavobacterium sp.]|uniref:hypothetical protein n=1 Tax=Flavobacterium sp. TaxID=239 RepID=UPI0025D3AB19|nr:hypothetical protein [Flavobacterium sp.]